MRSGSLTNFRAMTFHTVVELLANFATYIVVARALCDVSYAKYNALRNSTLPPTKTRCYVDFSVHMCLGWKGAMKCPFQRLMGTLESSSRSGAASGTSAGSFGGDE